VSAPVRAARRHADFDVVRDYQRLRGPLLGLLRRDGWTITDDEWDAAWNAVCTNVWKAQKRRDIDFRGEPLNYLLASAKNELRRERRRLRLETVSLDAADAPEPPAPGPELDDELDLRDKLRIAQTIARNRLRPHELRAWGLRVVCGLTYEEGAARLGIAPKRFEKQLLAAHAKIADEIRAVAAGTWCDSTKGVSLLRAYEEGVLDPEGSALRELREHARTCSACRRAMKAVEGIVPLMLPPAPVLLAATGSADGRALHRWPALWDATAAPRRAATELWRAISEVSPGAGVVPSAGADGAGASAGGLTPDIFERAMDAARGLVGRGTLHAAEIAPNGGTNAGELIGSAGAGGGVAVGGGVAAKLLVAGTAAVCTIGGPQVCADLLATQAPGRHLPSVVLHKRHHHESRRAARLAPPLPAAHPAAKPAPGTGRLARPGAKTLAAAARQRAGSSPASSAGAATKPMDSSNSTAPDPTFNQAASSSASGPSSPTGGGASGGGASGRGGASVGDSTFESLP